MTNETNKRKKIDEWWVWNCVALFSFKDNRSDGWFFAMNLVKLCHVDRTCWSVMFAWMPFRTLGMVWDRITSFVLFILTIKATSTRKQDSNGFLVLLRRAEAGQEEHNHQRSDDFLFHAGGSCVIDSTTSLSLHSNDTRLNEFLWLVYSILLFTVCQMRELIIQKVEKIGKRILEDGLRMNSPDQMTITRKQREIDKGSLLVIDAWLTNSPEILKLSSLIHATL